MKRIGYLFLAALMVLSIIPFSAFPVFAEKDSQGLTYRLSSDETYYIVSGCDFSATSFVIPATFNGLPVKEIEKWAVGVRNLEKIDVDENSKYFASVDGVLFNKNKTLLIRYPCKKESGVYKIPDSVKTIGVEAFANCFGLTSIEIPKSVKTINDAAFLSCIDLEKITVDKKNKYFTSVNGVLFNKNKTILRCYPIGKEGTVYNIPNGVTAIGSHAFYGCKSLTSIEIPNSVTNIGEWSFSWCEGVTNFEIPNSVTNIGGSAFSGCTGLTSIVIPNSVKSVGFFVFSDCTSLTSIAISDGVTTIGSHAFGWCESLTYIELPDSVTSIGERAFTYCENLTSVVIPNGVTTMGTAVFEEWSDKQTVYFEATSASDDWDRHWKSFCGAKIVWDYEPDSTFVKGDVNGNGKVDANDYALAKRHCLKTFTSYDKMLKRADLNGNGKLEASEYAMIKRHVLGTFEIK